MWGTVTAAKKKERTVAEKLACYERVVEIIEDRLALEGHAEGRNASSQDILFIRENAPAISAGTVMQAQEATEG